MVDEVRSRLRFNQSSPVKIPTELVKVAEEVVKADAFSEFAGIRISQIKLRLFNTINNSSSSHEEVELAKLQLERIENVDKCLSESRERLGYAAFYLRRLTDNE